MTPFCLLNASAMFQQMVSNVLKHKPYVRAYSNDVTVGSASMSVHMGLLIEVHSQIRESGVMITLTKYDFCKD